jgi:hypothetical protein
MKHSSEKYEEMALTQLLEARRTARSTYSATHAGAAQAYATLALVAVIAETTVIRPDAP